MGKQPRQLGPEVTVKDDRTAFVKTDVYTKIDELIHSLPAGETAKAPADVSGKMLLRVPKSIHASLMAEAEAEGISLNQLCLAKLSVQLQVLATPTRKSGPRSIML